MTTSNVKYAVLSQLQDYFRKYEIIVKDVDIPAANRFLKSHILDSDRLPFGVKLESMSYSEMLDLLSSDELKEFVSYCLVYSLTEQGELNRQKEKEAQKRKELIEEDRRLQEIEEYNAPIWKRIEEIQKEANAILYSFKLKGDWRLVFKDKWIIFWTVWVAICLIWLLCLLGNLRNHQLEGLIIFIVGFFGLRRLVLNYDRNLRNILYKRMEKDSYNLGLFNLCIDRINMEKKGLKKM